MGRGGGVDQTFLSFLAHAASSREKIKGSLVVRQQLLWEKLKIRTLKKYILVQN